MCSFNPHCPTNLLRSIMSTAKLIQTTSKRRERSLTGPKLPLLVLPRSSALIPLQKRSITRQNGRDWIAQRLLEMYRVRYTDSERVKDRGQVWVAGGWRSSTVASLAFMYIERPLRSQEESLRHSQMAASKLNGSSTTSLCKFAPHPPV